MLWQMIALLAVFILSSSKTTADFIPVNECVNYTTLHEANRSRFFSNYTTKISDDSLTGWFTFNGSAGKLMSTFCVPSNHCGTLVPGWMAGTHPAVEEGVAKRFVCFSMKQICCKASVSMRVRNCSGFYVYKLDMMPSFGYSFRVCGAGIEGSIPFVQTGSKNTSVLPGVVSGYTPGNTSSTGKPLPLLAKILIPVAGVLLIVVVVLAWYCCVRRKESGDIDDLIIESTVMVRLDVSDDPGVYS